jgi:type II secretory pathway pseudopilin PulG
MKKIISSDRGHLLITLVVALAVSMILITVATQVWTTVIRRDKEEELIFRGREYTRALKNFRKDRGRLPTDLKELTERGQSNQKYLRKLYKDPMSPDGEWNYLYLSPDGRGIINPNAAPIQQTDTSLGSQESEIQQPVYRADGGRIAGLQIAGIVSKCPDKAYREYQKKEHYNEWLFTIFDLPDFQQQQEQQKKPQRPQDQIKRGR